MRQATQWMFPMNRKNRTESGQAIVVIVVAILVLIGVTALAVDGGLYYADHRQAQNAADSAVLAASLARLRGEDFVSAALLNAQKNGYENDGARSEVQVSAPPISGQYEGDREYVQVTIVSHHQTYFGPVIGIRELTNTVQAVSRAIPPKFGPILKGYAVISLAPYSGCKSIRSFWAHEESTLELFGGGIFINSNSPSCAFMQEGSASLVFGDPTMQFNIVGGASIQKIELIKRILQPASNAEGRPGLPFRPTTLAFLPNTGNSAIPYPPPFDLPKVGCGNRIAAIDPKDPSVMESGAWEGDFPPDGVTTLQKGVYCINGDVRVEGEKLQGENVVLYVEKGSVHFSRTANIQLRAPVSGPLKGLLIYLPMDNKSLVVLNGGRDSDIRGTILAPSSKIRILGNDSHSGFHSQIIGYLIEVGGNAKIYIRYTEEQNYATFSSPEIQFGQ